MFSHVVRVSFTIHLALLIFIYAFISPICGHVLLGQPSVVRRADGMADLEALGRAFYQFQAKFNISAANMTLQNDTQDSGSGSVPTSKTRRRALQRRSNDDVIPVALTADPAGIVTGKYLGSMGLRGRQRGARVNFKTQFDTAFSDIFIPSMRCTEDDGCAGPATAKYDELGTVLVRLPRIQDLGSY